MLTLPLESTDSSANPVFRNADECARWLGQLQLTNLQLAHSQLYTQISELNRYAMPSQERLNSLELLRETVSYVQDDYAKKLIAKPLPLNEAELMVFVAIVQLWKALLVGYQHCLRAFIDGDPQLAGQGALLCQRCLHYSGLEIFEHLRTGYEFDDKLWQQLHDLYAYAEAHNLHLLEVNDPLTPVHPPGTCRSTYVKTLLACYARPAELTRSQLQLLDRWLTLWSHVVPVEHGYKLNEGEAKPLAVDLNSSRGLQPLAHPALAQQDADNAQPGETRQDGKRYLAMVPVSKLLRVNIVMLQQGQTPQQMNLGTHADRNDCIEYFTFLHQCLCEDRNVRTDERQDVEQVAQLCSHAENIYAHLTGKPFRQPERSRGQDVVNYREIATFGRVLQDAHDKQLLDMGFALETWNLENVSLMGARLVRGDPLGIRLSANQLIAVRPDDSSKFMLGSTAWVNVSHDGRLRIGVRFLPGTTEAVSIRATGVNLTVSEKYAPAFLLPEVPGLKAPMSLIIPRDWFQPNRVIEVLHQNKEKQNVKMGFSVQRGIDFERISFTPV